MQTIFDLNIAIFCIFIIPLIGFIKCDESQEPQITQEPDYSEQIKQELKELIVLKLDADKDGLVSYEELKKYLAELHEKNIEFNVNKQWIVYSPQIHEVFSWEGYEPETKEVLTWEHYFNQTYPELVGKNIPGVPTHQQQDTSKVLNKPDAQKPEKQSPSVEEYKDKDVDPQFEVLRTMALRADARWKLADENGDTLLTKQEFKYLLHPDEGHEELQKLFVKEATEDMDADRDGKICLDEFMKHLQVLASDQEKVDQSWLSSQQENFGRFLDKNKDGTLDDAEIKNWLVPAKSKKFETEATRLLNIGDRNDDKKLTSSEILDNYEQFISILPPEFWQALEDLAANSTEDTNQSGHEEL